MSNHPNDYNDPNRQGHYPHPQWNTSQPGESPSHYPPTSQYPYPPVTYPPPTADHQYPPPPAPAHYTPQSQYPPPSNMAAVHHMHAQQNYQLPPPPGAYRPEVAYGQPPPPPPPQGPPGGPPGGVPGGVPGAVVYQAAPRQRTAIACRYCRKRKIRCSGFESNPDGRCSNCIRFNQQCTFIPVSSHSQAFVPAHAAYPQLRNGQARPGGEPVVLYGAHGQPLPPQQQPQPGPETTLPPPQGMYPHAYGGAHPPLASVPQDHRPRRGSGSGYDYPDPTNLAPVTPVSSAPYQPRGGPYYPPPPHDRRPSPQTAYSYDSRHSSSPHSSPYPAMHAHNTVTPPPTSTPGSAPRNGLGVRDMLNPGENPGRSSTDSDMLNALDRRGVQ
ncbi:Zn(II)2Cys6 transcription factor domain-containing protein [Aspergillus undulatus]|uniref:Zn(II)2Cys6 transcription factor domain-containing protein n=1 Tax=Aspergillus undulatus TaxID=1810928 RepID=UPI003CCD00F2